MELFHIFHMVTKQLLDNLGMPVYSEHAIAAYFAHFPHIFLRIFQAWQVRIFWKKIFAINWHAWLGGLHGKSVDILFEKVIFQTVFEGVESGWKSDVKR